MNLGKFVFAQVMEHLPLHVFHRCVVRYSGEHKVKGFSCLDQYLCMAFAQLTYRESLRDIEACLRVQSSKLYLGLPLPIASFYPFAQMLHYFSAKRPARPSARASAAASRCVERAPSLRRATERRASPSGRPRVLGW